MGLLRSGTFIFYLLFVSIAITVVFSACRSQSRSEGKNLNEWLIAYEKADDGTLAEKQAEAAVRAMGTNALDQLIAWVASGDFELQIRAEHGFQILGPVAAPAVPTLGKFLKSTNGVEATIAAECLGYVGEPSLPILLLALANPDFHVGTAATYGIVELRTNARPAIPILLWQLENRNHFYRERAADTLGVLHIEPDVVVPALSRLLKDDSKAARYLAVSGLENFGSQARAAVPAITVLLTDPDTGVRYAATNALRTIAPEVLTNAVSH